VTAKVSRGERRREARAAAQSIIATKPLRSASRARSGQAEPPAPPLFHGHLWAARRIARGEETQFPAGKQRHQSYSLLPLQRIAAGVKTRYHQQGFVFNDEK
jgi:hypothetical protein